MSSPSSRISPDDVTAATVAAVQRTLDGRWHTVRDEIRDRPDFAELRVDPGLDVESYRAEIWEMLRRLADDGHAVHGFPTAVGGRGDIGASVVSFEMLAFADLSLQVKSGVQWGLFGGAIQALGNAEQHARFLPGVMDLSLPGCFAMTETGHGSDVQSVHTTATYDADTGEFVVDTPTESARKDYIGNAARDGRMAAVFVQLYTAAANATACTRSSSPCATTTARSCPASRSPTTGTRRGSTASTTAGWRSAACACRARTSSTATAPSPRTARTRARSRARTAASSPCSARSSAAA